MKIRLRGIKLGADFRKSELTNYEALRKSKHFPTDPRRGEAYLMVSKNGKQLCWILRYSDVPKHIDSLKFRITRSTWNPQMLANYAEQVGLELVGIRKFEDQFETYKTTKKALVA